MIAVDEAKPTAYRKALALLEEIDPAIARTLPSPDSVLRTAMPRPEPASQGSADAAVPPKKISKKNVTEIAPLPKKSASRKRGMGWLYQPSWRDKKTGQRKVSPTWWVAFSARGKLIRESSHSTKESVALKLLKKRLGEIASGKPVGPDIEKTTFEDMAAMIIADYKANKRRSLARLEDAIAHLREFFGDYRAVEITGDTVTAYVAFRQEQKAANSTINTELAALSRMFTLAIRSNKAAVKPYIGKLALNNTRKGFFEWEQFSPVLKNLPEDLQPAIEAAYITGWRIHDEIFTRQKHHADMKGPGWLRLAQQLERTRARETATGRVIPWQFHRAGRRIKTFRRSWLTACVKVGLGTEIRSANGKLIKKIGYRIPHDFRRTAVRNLERAGVSRSDAMKMVGHKTEAIYRRYAIADEKSMKEAASKLDQFHLSDQKNAAKSPELAK